MPLFSAASPRGRRALAAALIAGAALLAPAAGAHAATSGNTTSTITVNPGTLSLTAPTSATFPAVTLTGAQQTSTFAIAPIGVVDARGTGVGWTVSAQAADFVTTGAHYIAFTNLTVGNSAPTATDSSSSLASGITQATAAPLSGADTTPGTTASSAGALLTAPANQGLGSYSESSPDTLKVPASTYAGATYSTTIIFQVQ